MAQSDSLHKDLPSDLATSVIRLKEAIFERYTPDILNRQAAYHILQGQINSHFHQAVGWTAQ